MEPIKVSEPQPNRAFLTGLVVSDKMDKTVVVTVGKRTKHKKYHKIVSQNTKYKAHDENNVCRVNDKVRMQESRHYSKDKYWRVIEILERQEEVG
jgi:small subunit ribosomal protein S17